MPGCVRWTSFQIVSRSSTSCSCRSICARRSGESAARSRSLICLCSVKERSEKSCATCWLLRLSASGSNGEVSSPSSSSSLLVLEESSPSFGGSCSLRGFSIPAFSAVLECASCSHHPCPLSRDGRLESPPFLPGTQPQFEKFFLVLLI